MGRERRENMKKEKSLKYNGSHAGGGRRGRKRRRHTLEFGKMARAFLREDRTRGKRWRGENHCGRAMKCPGRVPNASDGRSEWIFRRVTVPNKKVTKGKSVGNVSTDIFAFQNFSSAGDSRRPPV